MSGQRTGAIGSLCVASIVPQLTLHALGACSPSSRCAARRDGIQIPLRLGGERKHAWASRSDFVD